MAIKRVIRRKDIVVIETTEGTIKLSYEKLRKAIAKGSEKVEAEYQKRIREILKKLEKLPLGTRH